MPNPFSDQELSNALQESGLSDNSRTRSMLKQALGEVLNELITSGSEADRMAAHWSEQPRDPLKLAIERVKRTVDEKPRAKLGRGFVQAIKGPEPE